MSSNYPAGLSHDSNSKQKREGGTAVRTAAIVWDPYPMYTSLCPLCFRKNIHYLEGGDCLLCPCRQHGTVCAPCSQQSLSSTIFLVERGSFNFYPNQYRLASHYNSPVPNPTINKTESVAKGSQEGIRTLRIRGSIHHVGGSAESSFQRQR